MASLIRSDYIDTSSGSIVSRQAHIFQPQNVELPAGKVHYFTSYIAFVIFVISV